MPTTHFAFRMRGAVSLKSVWFDRRYMVVVVRQKIASFEKVLQKSRYARCGQLQSLAQPRDVHAENDAMAVRTWKAEIRPTHLVVGISVYLVYAVTSFTTEQEREAFAERCSVQIRVHFWTVGLCHRGRR